MDRDLTLIFLLFGFSLSSCSEFPLRTYHYINLKMTWINAQHYCRRMYDDLATFESMDDISRLKPAFPFYSSWIGLSDDPKSWRGVMGNDSNSWRWSATGDTSKTGYHKWKVSKNQKCVMMDFDGGWFDKDCSQPGFFVCYTATNQSDKTYVFINTRKSWHSAQVYCREHHTDLAMIENSAENKAAYSVKLPGVQSWIGLYRVPWTWSDKTRSSFSRWAANQPDNYRGNQFCGSEFYRHEWVDLECTKKFPFICQQVSELKTKVRVKIQTDADMTDPAINGQILQQLGAMLKSQGWTDFNLRWTIEPQKQENEVTKPR